MAKLEGKIALIAGGTGGVSEGIVRAFLQFGTTVIVPSRTQEKLEELRGYLGATERFIPIVGDMSDSDRKGYLCDRLINQVGQMEAVVASLNGRWNEDIPLLKTSLEDWKRMLDSNLTSHFVAARTFLPVLKREGKGNAVMGNG